MLIKTKYFVLILLLACLRVRTEIPDKALNNVIQCKDIHITDLQGVLGAMRINSSHKDIKTLNIVSNESLLPAFEQRDSGQNELIQLQKDQLETQAAAISELKAQLANLDASMFYLKSWLADNIGQQTATSCLAFDGFTTVRVISVPGVAPFQVLCDSCGAGSGWLVIQSRFDGELNFNRNWNAYRNGFGLYTGEFFLGLEYIHRLTKSLPYELYIELVDFEHQVYYARYDSFLIGSEEEQYMLKSLGTYSGNAGDALRYNLYDKFSTYDCDNDGWAGGSCASYYESGWWYNWDSNSNLNGRYFKSGEKNIKGIWWYTINGYDSLNSVKMLIRPKYTLL